MASTTNTNAVAVSSSRKRKVDKLQEALAKATEALSNADELVDETEEEMKKLAKMYNDERYAKLQSDKTVATLKAEKETWKTEKQNHEKDYAKVTQKVDTLKTQNEVHDKVLEFGEQLSELMIKDTPTTSVTNNQQGKQVFEIVYPLQSRTKWIEHALVCFKNINEHGEENKWDARFKKSVAYQFIDHVENSGFEVFGKDGLTADEIYAFCDAAGVSRRGS